MVFQRAQPKLRATFVPTTRCLRASGFRANDPIRSEKTAQFQAEAKDLRLEIAVSHRIFPAL